jgi:hypothetical protein
VESYEGTYNNGYYGDIEITNITGTDDFNLNFVERGGLDGVLTHIGGDRFTLMGDSDILVPEVYCSFTVENGVVIDFSEEPSPSFGVRMFLASPFPFLKV